MPNIKSAEKRVKIAAKKTLQNQMIKSQLKTIIKKFEIAVVEADKSKATELYTTVIKKLDQAASKGTYHKNTISRRKSQMTIKLNGLSA